MHDLLLTVNNLVFIGSEALPATGQSTRSTRALSSNAITYILSEVGLLLRIINNSHFNAHTDPVFKDLGILNLMISICFNWTNLCILAKIHSYLQSVITISLKAIQEIPRPTVLSYKHEDVLALFSRAY